MLRALRKHLVKVAKAIDFIVVRKIYGQGKELDCDIDGKKQTDSVRIYLSQLFAHRSVVLVAQLILQTVHPYSRQRSSVASFPGELLKSNIFLQNILDNTSSFEHNYILSRTLGPNSPSSATVSCDFRTRYVPEVRNFGPPWVHRRKSNSLANNSTVCATTSRPDEGFFPLSEVLQITNTLSGILRRSLDGRFFSTAL